jgi:hypothetical protein
MLFMTPCLFLRNDPRWWMRRSESRHGSRLDWSGRTDTCVDIVITAGWVGCGGANSGHLDRVTRQSPWVVVLSARERWARHV